MYYVIETTYVGPNPDFRCDADTIEIRTEPARTNSSHDICISGWCGTSGDWNVIAHGQYFTIDEARSSIKKIFGDVRDSDENGDIFRSDDETVVETYKPGKYAPMSRQDTADWAHDCIESIEAGTTDERIDDIIYEQEAEANQLGYTVYRYLYDFLWDRREELRYEASMED